MDTVTLSGSTIRGSVKGRTINCSVKTSPVGLKLPAGTYLLKSSSDNPVYGATVSIQATAGSVQSPAAVATLLPPGSSVAGRAAAPAAVKFAPGTPATHKDAPPTAHKIAPPATHAIAAATAHKLAPAGKVIDAPASPRDPASGLVQAQRVLISDRAIGENCFVALAGFSDLIDAVKQAGEVTLVVT
jgi:hypothetical protein